MLEDWLLTFFTPDNRFFSRYAFLQSPASRSVRKRLVKFRPIIGEIGGWAEFLYADEDCWQIQTRSRVPPTIDGLNDLL